jgi:hypothetical protein
VDAATAVVDPAAGSFSVTVRLGTSVVADINADEYTDVSDLLALAGGWGTCAGGAGYNPICDLDCNYCVDEADKMILAVNWAQSPPSGQMLMGQDSGASYGSGEGQLLDPTQPAPQTAEAEASNGLAPDRPPVQYDASWYEALEHVGLLDEWLDYMATHPDGPSLPPPILPRP